MTAFDINQRNVNERNKFASSGTDQTAIRVIDASVDNTGSSTEFIETGTVTYSASGDEGNITLNRGTSWKITAIKVYTSKGQATSLWYAFNLSAGSTANQRDPAHADSIGVLMGKAYYTNRSEIAFEGGKTFATGLRLRFESLSAADTIYVTVTYIPIS